MLISLWSPKGGSGTSVVAAAVASQLARSGPCHLVDLRGDQAAIAGLGADPATGVLDWMALPGALSDSLERLGVEVASGLVLLPAGRSGAPPDGDAGRALVTALATAPGPAVVDVGNDRSAGAHAVVEGSDVALLVMRGCYLALRRAAAHPLLACTSGVVLLREPARAIDVRDVGAVLEVPVVAVLPLRASVARAVDAGVLLGRQVEGFVGGVRALVERAGLTTARGRR